MWNWIDSTTLINKDDPTAYKVYDGAGTESGCTDNNISPYSYNYGILIGGLAYIYNHVSPGPISNRAIMNVTN